MLDQQVNKLTARPRFNAVLLGIFAALGVAPAGTGVCGLISFVVAHRTQEIGVRMAPGATPGGIVRLVLRLAAAWTAGGAAVSTLFGAAMAALIPARHAAGLYPAEVLRRE